MIKGSYMKDGGMNRDPRPPSKVSTFKRGAKQTIQKMSGGKK